MKVPYARPKLAPYVGWRQPAAPKGHRGLRATWLGVSTLLFDDGQTTLMIDGFFSRPSLLRCGTMKIYPEPGTIARSLNSLAVEELDAVICAHSHYDHAMDAPLVARQTGAELVGSESTANIGRGCGLPEQQLRTPATDEPVRYGAFTVTLVESVHNHPDRFPGTVNEPLLPPARVGQWATGTAYSIFVEHPQGTLLVHASAGYVPGALAGRSADVVYLGVGTLGKLGASFRAVFWDEVVATTGARRVVPVHWDDMWRPLDGPLLPMRYAMDDFGVTLDFLTERGRSEGVDIAVPVAWRNTAPLAGLPEH